MAVNAFEEYPELKLQPFDWGFVGDLYKYKQSRKDKEDEEIYKLPELMKSIKSATFDREHKKAVDDEYYGEVSNIINKHVSGQDTKNDVLRLRGKLATDPRIGLLNHNYEEEEKYLKDKQEYDKTSKYDQIYDPLTPQVYGQHTKELSPFDYKGMPSKEDYVENFQSLMTGINSDSKGWEGYAKDKGGNLIVNDYGQIQKSDGKWEKITPEKVRYVAESNALSALHGKGGKYFTDKYFGQPVDYDSLPEAYQKEVRNRAADELELLGQKYIMKKSSNGVDLQNLRESALDNQSSLEPAEIGGQHITIDPTLKVSLPGVGTNILKNVENFMMSGNGVSPKDNIPNEENFKGNFSAAQKTILEKAQKAYGQAPQNDYKAAQLINKWLEDKATQGISQGIMLEKNAKKIENDNHRLFGTDVKGALQMTTRDFKLIDGNGKTTNTGKDIAKSYGNTDKYSINATGYLTPSNMYYPAGRVITITDKASGNVVAQYAMSGTKDEMSQNRILHEMYKAKTSPDGQSKVNIQGNTYTIDYEEQTDPKQLDDQGRPIKTGESVRIIDSKGNVFPPKNEPPAEDAQDAIYKLYLMMQK